MDSNHRSRRQQIYSLPPLAARELSHVLGINKSLSLFVELVMGGEADGARTRDLQRDRLAF